MHSLCYNSTTKRSRRFVSILFLKKFVDNIRKKKLKMCFFKKSSKFFKVWDDNKMKRLISPKRHVALVFIISSVSVVLVLILESFHLERFWVKIFYVFYIYLIIIYVVLFWLLYCLWNALRRWSKAFGRY